MKTLFTVHAGEFLVGSKIQQEIKEAEIWLPAKDTGVDLLVTNRKHTRLASLQVKFSRDYTITHMDSKLAQDIVAFGWWTHNREKIRRSKADLWVFVIQAFDPKQTQYILIPPQELEERFEKIHGGVDPTQSYFWVTRRGKCWETHDLPKKDLLLIAKDDFPDKDHDFSDYLNAWEVLARKLK